MGGVCSAVKKLSAAHLGIQEEWDEYELNQMDGIDSAESQVCAYSSLLHSPALLYGIGSYSLKK
jgi:hypothetical protein